MYQETPHHFPSLPSASLPSQGRHGRRLILLRRLLPSPPLCLATARAARRQSRPATRTAVAGPSPLLEEASGGDTGAARERRSAAREAAPGGWRGGSGPRRRRIRLPRQRIWPLRVQGRATASGGQRRGRRRRGVVAANPATPEVDPPPLAADPASPHPGGQATASLAATAAGRRRWMRAAVDGCGEGEGLGVRPVPVLPGRRQAAEVHSPGGGDGDGGPRPRWRQRRTAEAVVTEGDEAVAALAVAAAGVGGW
ncbi:hypothetical protein OsJ_14836 [Oryza sativa Japonica Group]|uniref:Uncharacterized protein n=1 Tax=Oryza sativa subsp. japonica TaxID=39947 RepID=B9FF80_ORYSJ|nr:hypothetical protein OsJ_14836 [Oryza sativa Japonica Group]